MDDDLKALDDAKLRFERLVKQYYYQFTTGCGDSSCVHKLCHSNPNCMHLSPDMAVMLSLQMAARPSKRILVCPRCPSNPDIQLPTSLFRDKTPSSNSASSSTDLTIPSEPRPFLNSLFSSKAFQALFAGDDKAEGTVDQQSGMGALQGQDKNENTFFGRARSFFDLSSLFSSLIPQTKTPADLNDYDSPSESTTTASLRGSPSLTRAASRESMRSLSNLVTSSEDELENVWDDELTLEQGSAKTFFTYDRLNRMTLQLRASQMTPRPDAAAKIAPVTADNDVMLQRLCSVLRRGFSSSSLLTSSFHATQDGNTNRPQVFGLDIQQLRETYDLLLNQIGPHVEVDRAISEALNILLARLSVVSSSWHVKRSEEFGQLDGTMRLWLILLENPMLIQAEYADVLLKQVCISIARARRHVKGYFVRQMAATYAHDTAFLHRLVEALNRYIIRGFVSGSKFDDGVVAAIRTQSVLYNINELTARYRPFEFTNTAESRHRTAIPFTAFYVTLGDSPLAALNYKEELPRWRKTVLNMGAAKSEFSVLNYPFLLDPMAKTRALRVESVVAMSGGFEQAFVHHAFVVQAQKLVNGLQHVSEVGSSSRSVSRSSSRLLNDEEDGIVRSSSGAQALSSLSTNPTDMTATAAASLSGPAPSRLNMANLETSFQPWTNPYIVLEVRRDHLVEDTLSQLRSKQKDIRKPLKIRFISTGEEGLDQGGVQTEFFQLICQQLLDPEFGLCVYFKETRLMWIKNNPQKLRLFELIGMILGLAVYNGVMLDMQFPDVFYKKLLFEDRLSSNHKKSATNDNEQLDTLMDELAQLYPELHRGLILLLNWDAERDGGSVEDIFCRNFEISYEEHGQVRTCPLIENGSDIPVTEDNRRHYCMLYVRHLLNESIAEPLAAIRKGFWKVLGQETSSKRPVDSTTCLTIRLFRPEELRLLLTGLATSNHGQLYSSEAFKSLQASAKYDEYDPKSSFVHMFWDAVLNEFNDDQRRKLLWFVTASDRIPLGGLREVTFIVQRNGSDDSRLPTAMTCFGRLLLPEYSSKQILMERLGVAIEESQGFGLV